MQLSGALEAFRVQDVLGLVGRKPGQWKITLDGGPRGHSAFIGLRDRQVVSISADSSHQDLARRLVIEFEGDTLTGLAEQRLVESNVEVSGGKLLRTEIDQLPGSSNRRLFVDVELESKRTADVRAFLTVDEKRVSETFASQVRS